jgi:hypothetical protein
MNIPMFTKKPDLLKEAIDKAALELMDCEPGTEEYAKVLGQLEKLIKMNDIKSPSKVSRDTLVLAMTNIAGIVLVLHYEHARIVTSKALGFIKKS